MISHRERFIGFPNPIGGLFAPLTIGAPAFLNIVDYETFKKTKDEKLEIKIVKGLHKKDLEKVYGIGKIGRHLNIPSKELIIAH